MKSNIRPWLWLSLLLGSACAEQQEVIENSQLVNVNFKTQPLPETRSGGGKEDLTILVFKKENESSFSKSNPLNKIEWNNFQTNILLPVGTYRFLLAQGFSTTSSDDDKKASFVEEDKEFSPAIPISTTYSKEYYFRHPKTTINGAQVLQNCTTPLMADVNKNSENASQTEYNLSTLNKLSISRTATHLQGLFCFIVRRAKKEGDKYTPWDTEGDAYNNALRKIKRIELTIEGASSRCYLFADGLKFANPLPYSCSLEKEEGDYLFKTFDSTEFMKKFKSEDKIGEELKKGLIALEGSAYCEGPLLFPAPEENKIKIKIAIIYNETLKTKTFNQEIDLKRNQVQLFTLWLLNEDINVSVGTELDLERLTFSDKVSGDDGFWN